VLVIDHVLLAAGVVMTAVVLVAVFVFRLGVSSSGAVAPATAAIAGNQRPTPAGIPAPGERDPIARWRAVLAELNETRARAWHLGRPALLTEVYVPGSAALRADRTSLERYVSRGLRVHGARLQLGSVTVQRHDTAEVTLVVVDRLGPASVVTAAGQREPLPRDQPTRHRIALRRVNHSWRIATIARAQAPSPR
jgi:hypothetical protein